MTPPEQRIASGYENDTIKGAALVAITASRHTHDPIADTHPWIARARLLKPIVGSGLPRFVEFARGWGSSACEWNLPPLPKKGDKWVVYFWIDRTGQHRPWLALPLAEARQYDRRIRGLN